MFQAWLDSAIAKDLPEPNAMLVATAALDAKPSPRLVLLRGMDEHGFVFFTNYSSRKGKGFKESPFAALVFFWQPLHLKFASKDRLNAYRRKSPMPILLPAHGAVNSLAAASAQSQVIPNLAALETPCRNSTRNFQTTFCVPRNGAHPVVPDVFEFWQDAKIVCTTVRYTRGVNNSWKIERLAP